MKSSDLSVLRVPGTPTLSPDGRLAVVAVSYPDLDVDDYVAQLWLVPTDGSASARQLTHGWRDTDPVWSPDGRWLAFLRAEPLPSGGPRRMGPPQLWLLPIDGGEARRLTDHPLGVEAPVWSPDSTRLAYLARVRSLAATAPTRASRRRRSHLGGSPRCATGWTALATRWTGVAMCGRSTSRGRAGPGDDGDFDHTSVDWSPAGDSPGVHRRPAPRCRRRPAVRRVGVPPGRRRPAGVDPGWVRGRVATVLPRRAPGVLHVGTACGARPVPGRAQHRGLGGACRRVGLRRADSPIHRLTPFPRSGGMIATTANGVLFPEEYRGAVRLLRVPYHGDEPTVLVDGPRQVTGVATAGDTTVVTVTDPTTPGELAVVVIRTEGLDLLGRQLRRRGGRPTHGGGHRYRAGWLSGTRLGREAGR